MDIQKWKIAKKKKGLSYDDIAKITGYSRSTITNIFCGYIEFPRYETIQAIERALDITEDAPQTPQQPVSTPNPSDEYTNAEKRVIAAYRTLVPGMQDYILEMIEKLADVDTGENKGKKVNRA